MITDYFKQQIKEAKQIINKFTIVGKVFIFPIVFFGMIVEILLLTVIYLLKKFFIK